MLERFALADPGLGGDTLRTIEDEPGVTTSSALAIDGVALRGATPQESRVLVDGFEVPFLYHFGLRSIVPDLFLGGGGLVPGGFDVERGRATAGLLDLETTRGGHRRTTFEVSAVDATLARSAWTNRSDLVVGLRASPFLWWTPVLALDKASFTSGPAYVDGFTHVEHVFRDWTLNVSSLFALDQVTLYTDRAHRDDQRRHNSRAFGRVTVAAAYQAAAWEYLIAGSVMPSQRTYERGVVQHDRADELAFDARASARRRIGWVAGLRAFTVSFGADTDVVRHELDVAMPVQPRENAPQVGDPDPLDTSHRFAGIVWTPDAGVWGQLEGGLSPAITAKLGLRVDAFGSELAPQPRGELAIKLAEHTTTTLGAGAYCRPAEDREELEHPELHPERATQVEARFTHDDDQRRYHALLYYADRTHLIERGGDGVLRNSGRGTSYGAELGYAQQWHAWHPQISIGLAHSTRQESPVKIDRPAEFDQPLRVDATLTWQRGGWSIGGRLELRSGLPYTPVQAAIYDSERDRYDPILGRVYSERAPFHHQLDLRIDRVWRHPTWELAVYLDIANVYDNRSAAGYVYNFDFSQKTALESLPILPMLGVRGAL